VSRSLASVYPTLLTGGDVTPDHYLEKIFQLPMWLDSPSADAAQQMLSGILRPDLGQGGTAIQPALQAAAADSQTGVSLPAGAPAGRILTSEADFATSTPKELELTPEEVGDITALAGLVSRSPRAVKRFINTYHLLKVIEGDPTELERVRVLLAIAVGRPPLGERLLMMIMLDQVLAQSLAEILDEQPADDRAWLAQGIASRQATWARMTSGNSVRAARHVHRFVYRAGEVAAAAGGVVVQTPGPGTWSGSLGAGQ
jgi:hypothetical protein